MKCLDHNISTIRILSTVISKLGASYFLNENVIKRTKRTERTHPLNYTKKSITLFTK